MRRLREYLPDLALWTACVLHACLWGLLLAKWAGIFRG